jgi:hypothetical protein
VTGGPECMTLVTIGRHNLGWAGACKITLFAAKNPTPMTITKTANNV